MTIDRDPTAGLIGLAHATALIRHRKGPAVSAATLAVRDELADLMANGCPTISEAARRMRITQSRADQHWQAIKTALGGQAV